jgi:integrase
MGQTETQKLDKLLKDERLETQQLERLNSWVKHLRAYQQDGKILEFAYTIREFGLFIKKPYELAGMQELEEYFEYKREANQTITNNRVLHVSNQSLIYYRRKINLFYQWMIKHTSFTINPDVAYHQPKVVLKERKDLEWSHKERAKALLDNRIILTNRKEDRKLSQEELNRKYSNLLLDEANLKVLNDYYNYKTTSKKIKSHMGFINKLYFIKRLGLHLRKKRKTFKDATREDIQDFLSEVQQTLDITKRKPGKTSTELSYHAHILDFYRYVYGIFTNEQPRTYPEVVAWLYQSRDKRDVHLPQEVIPDSEIRAMIDRAGDIRDKAIMALFADCSARVGEIINTNLKDLQLTEARQENAKYSHTIATITLRGKTGERTNQLFYSVPYLRLWLISHPRKDEPEAPLFVATKESRYGQRLTPCGLNKILQRTAIKAGIKRHIHAHLFRHTNLTRMARFLSETELKIHAGWGAESDMATVYVHLNERDVAVKILSQYGIKQGEVKQEAKLMDKCICPNVICNFENVAEANFCVKCGYPMKVETAYTLAKIKQKEDELQKELFAKNITEIPANGDIREALYQVLKSDPELVKKLKEIFNLTNEAKQ